KQREITELYRTGQEFGLLAVVRTKDIPSYKRFLENIYTTSEIHDTISTLVIDEKLPATFQPFG
ncbi:MAG: hypothetical protein GF364_06075, partial [Candidatus Lokiarchaeota archaeon]|nr:hypothetical protein [Candidatus Lokiarchaeota archaeon]